MCVSTAPTIIVIILSRMHIQCRNGFAHGIPTDTIKILIYNPI